ncbi:MAG: hypothetical protein KDJ28_01555 [Candidatus Competibacteraceae bacterium]|nr:hypothetical protein [Candidatus Competibacteraceae bacterium]
MTYNPTPHLRQHYLSLPGKTEAGWKNVMRDPYKFNRLWRHALRLELRDDPPPIDLRRIDLETGELHQEFMP